MVYPENSLVDLCENNFYKVTLSFRVLVDDKFKVKVSNLRKEKIVFFPSNSI